VTRAFRAELGGVPNAAAALGCHGWGCPRTGPAWRVLKPVLTSAGGGRDHEPSRLERHVVP
jgi:hypothetical protein